jgi:DedD protein
MAVGAQMSEKNSDQVRDTEITLSTGKLLGIFFVLAIICGVFFTMGYLLGRSTSAGGRTEIVSSVPSGSAAGKPTAGNKASQAPASACPPDSPNCAAPSSGDPGGNAASARTSDASASQPASSGKTADSSNAAAADAKGQTGSFMVQVAAVSRQEDAEILKNSLQKKQYPVFIANSAGDPLFHVQVGPFTDRKDAEAMKVKLAGDGYNAIVK